MGGEGSTLMDVSASCAEYVYNGWPRSARIRNPVEFLVKELTVLLEVATSVVFTFVAYCTPMRVPNFCHSCAVMLFFADI